MAGRKAPWRFWAIYNEKRDFLFISTWATSRQGAIDHWLSKPHNEPHGWQHFYKQGFRAVRIEVRLEGK